MKLNKFIALLFITNLSFSQYQTTGKIKPVSQNGLHEIVLSPEIRSYSKQDLSDIRIFDAKGNEIPYFIQSNNTVTSDTFEEYTIVSKTVSPKKSTSVIIAIPPNKQNNQLSLFIANSDVEKKYSVSGSDDQKEWFGISDSQTLYNLNSVSETSVVKTISYPLSTYHYLKIDFDDRKTLSVNILKVGNFSTQSQKSILQEITPKKTDIKENASQKETQIHVLFDAPQVINQITFEISKPTYYKRTAILYKKITRETRRKSQIVDEEIFSFELSSAAKNTFTFPEIFEKEFFIKIENHDNQPLQISKIKYAQKPVSIVADLNTDENYIIKTGNKNLAEPEYDLSNFRSNIAANLPQTSLYDIQQKTTVKSQTASKSFWQQSWFMWICIALGGITILFFTTSLVKDLKRKN
ncbi:hypothetical protein ASF10_16750 [Flavobacterium sp. Leaf82]|uniref:hypothetical protein n=1 Tax=unclassified Flavobacterium TaxID=196869 RepID=UPI0006F9794F|nr:hypothetical protein [Flavobacterium sp. Leaf82]KQO20334.1 hypothetical protein ASF10_16750 [Flavobacterium sp. Leaf82]